MIEGRGLREEVELGADEGIVEVLVVGAVADVGAVTDKEALAVAEVLVDALGDVVVLGLLGRAGVLVVGQAERIAGRLLRARVIRQDRRADLIEAARRN